MVEDHSDFEIVTGLVKWFDPIKGFGFVVSDSGHPDILLHANVLRNFGQSSIADNAKIKIKIQKTQRGYQAIQVLNVNPPDETTKNAGFSAPVTDGDIKNAELLPARVKWFDATKGFGFANAFGSDEDVFIHVDLLHRSGLAGLMPGEAIAIKTIDGERGRMAVEVAGWERGIK